MRKASTGMLEQGIQAPSPAPDPPLNINPELTLGLEPWTGAHQLKMRVKYSVAMEVRQAGHFVPATVFVHDAQS
jgi:hypothetical protein